MLESVGPNGVKMADATQSLTWLKVLLGAMGTACLLTGRVELGLLYLVLGMSAEPLRRLLSTPAALRCQRPPD